MNNQNLWGYFQTAIYYYYFSICISIHTLLSKESVTFIVKTRDVIQSGKNRKQKQKFMTRDTDHDASDGGIYTCRIINFSFSFSYFYPFPCPTSWWVSFLQNSCPKVIIFVVIVIPDLT